MKNFRVVLVEPEIPSNTGNIGRTCVTVQSELHLVGPLGFEINNKRLKRAGLDYWPYLKWTQHKNWKSWSEKELPSPRVWFFSTKGKTSLYSAYFEPGDTFVFGKETQGLQESILEQFKDQVLTIPMLGPGRSLNLASAVAIVLYEAFRQTNPFPLSKGKEVSGHFPSNPIG